MEQDRSLNLPNPRLPSELRSNAIASQIQAVGTHEPNYLSAMLDAQKRMTLVLEQLVVQTPQDVPKKIQSAKSDKRYERGGMKWTPEEEEVVISLFEGGDSVEGIARAQKRSWVGIIARLEHMGYVPRDLRLADIGAGPKTRETGVLNSTDGSH